MGGQSYKFKFKGDDELPATTAQLLLILIMELHLLRMALKHETKTTHFLLQLQIPQDRDL